MWVKSVLPHAFTRPRPQTRRLMLCGDQAGDPPDPFPISLPLATLLPRACPHAHSTGGTVSNYYTPRIGIAVLLASCPNWDDKALGRRRGFSGPGVIGAKSQSDLGYLHLPAWPMRTLPCRLIAFWPRCVSFGPQMAHPRQLDLGKSGIFCPHISKYLHNGFDFTSWPAETDIFTLWLCKENIYRPLH